MVIGCYAGIGWCGEAKQGSIRASCRQTIAACSSQTIPSNMKQVTQRRPLVLDDGVYKSDRALCMLGAPSWFMKLGRPTPDQQPSHAGVTTVLSTFGTRPCPDHQANRGLRVDTRSPGSARRPEPQHAVVIMGPPARSARDPENDQTSDHLSGDMMALPICTLSMAVPALCDGLIPTSLDS